MVEPTLKLTKAINAENIQMAAWAYQVSLSKITLVA